MEDSVSAEVNTDSLEIDGKRITVSTLGDSAIHAAIVEAFGRTYEMGTEDIGSYYTSTPKSTLKSTLKPHLWVIYIEVEALDIERRINIDFPLIGDITEKTEVDE